MAEQLRMIGVGGLGLMLGPSSKHLSGADSPARFLRMHDRGTLDERRNALRGDWAAHGAELVSDFDALVGDGDFEVIVVCAAKNGSDLEIFRALAPIVAERCAGPVTIVHLSTVSAGFVRAAQEFWARFGCVYVCYPLTGGPKGANDKSMLMLASGPKGVYDWLLPMLSRIGAPKYLGEDIAAGAIVKLVGQMKVFNGLQGSASAVAAHAAAFLSGVVGGEQQAAFFDFLNGGAGGTRQWDVAMRQGVADDVWDQGFMAEHAAVDAVYTAQMALEQGLPYEACVRPMLLMAAELAFIMTQYDGSLSLATHAIVKAFLAQSAGLLDDFLGNVLSKRGGSPEAVIQQVINALPVDVRQSVMLDITAADFAA